MKNNLKRNIKSLYRIVTNPQVITYYKHSIILRTLPKSGTNYLRLILTNYFSNLKNLENNQKFEEVDYDRMNTLFPNIRDHVFRGKKYKPAEISFKNVKGEKYSDFMYDHGSIIEKYIFRFLIKPKKLIFLYRNPLDILISRYFYFYKNRVGKEELVEHPREIISTDLPKFIKDYAFMRHYKQQEKNVMMVSYEDLKKSPEIVLEKILSYLEVMVDDRLISFSIQAAEIKKVREMEKKRKNPIHSPKKGLRGSFARSGAIGQWKEFFEEDDLEEIRNSLEKSGISVENFVTE